MQGEKVIVSKCWWHDSNYDRPILSIIKSSFLYIGSGTTIVWTGRNGPRIPRLVPNWKCQKKQFCNFEKWKIAPVLRMWNWVQILDSLSFKKKISSLRDMAFFLHFQPWWKFELYEWFLVLLGLTHDTPKNSDSQNLTILPWLTIYPSTWSNLCQ